MVAAQPISEKSLGTDAAKEGGRLLEIISVAGYVGTALLEFKRKRESELPQCAVDDLNVLIEALNCVHDKGRKQISKVSTIGYLVPAYDMCRRRLAKKENSRPSMRVSESMWRSKEYVRKCRSNLLWKDGVQVKKKAKVVLSPPLSPPNKKRKSDQIINHISPDTHASRIKGEFDGRPPDGDKMWSKKKLITALNRFEGMKAGGVKGLED